MPDKDYGLKEEDDLIANNLLLSYITDAYPFLNFQNTHDLDTSPEEDIPYPTGPLQKKPLCTHGWYINQQKN